MSQCCFCICCARSRSVSVLLWFLVVCNVVLPGDHALFTYCFVVRRSGGRSGIHAALVTIRVAGVCWPLLPLSLGIALASVALTAGLVSMLLRFHLVGYVFRPGDHAWLRYRCDVHRFGDRAGLGAAGVSVSVLRFGDKCFPLVLLLLGYPLRWRPGRSRNCCCFE